MFNIDDGFPRTYVPAPMQGALGYMLVLSPASIINRDDMRAASLLVDPGLVTAIGNSNLSLKCVLVMKQPYGSHRSSNKSVIVSPWLRSRVCPSFIETSHMLHPVKRLAILALYLQSRPTGHDYPPPSQLTQAGKRMLPS